MTRVSTNVLSLGVQRSLLAAGQAMSRSIERLSTGLRINRASDDPAGLVASERLRSERVALDAATRNATRATAIVGTAESGLEEISSLLLDIEGLVLETANTAGMTSDEIAANQLQIDEAIASIDRIASTTQFSGQKLLDGTVGFNTGGLVTSDLSSVVVSQAVFSGTQMAVGYNIDATTAAKGEVTMAAANIALANGSVTITGNKGSAQVTFTAGMSQAQVIDAINTVGDNTGVTAVADGADIDFRSTEYGSSQQVSFTRLGSAVFTLSADQDYGADATVTSIGGSATGLTVEGLKVSVRRTGLEMDIVIADNTVVENSGSFNIESGGLQFQIAAEIGSNGRIGIGIGSVDSAYLGDVSTGFLNTLKTGGDNDLASGNFTTAAAVVDSASSRVARVRGQLGAVQQNVLETSIQSLGAARQYVAGAESAIRDVDYASEMARVLRSQMLMQVGLSALAVANSASRSVLLLLQNTGP